MKRQEILSLKEKRKIKNLLEAQDQVELALMDSGNDKDGRFSTIFLSFTGESLNQKNIHRLTEDLSEALGMGRFLLADLAQIGAEDQDRIRGKGTVLYARKKEPLTYENSPFRHKCF